jgi:hypothetical protein
MEHAEAAINNLKHLLEMEITNLIGNLKIELGILPSGPPMELLRPMMSEEDIDIAAEKLLNKQSNDS